MATPPSCSTPDSATRTRPSAPSSPERFAGGLLPGAAHGLSNRLTGLSFAADATETELADGSPQRASEFLRLLREGLRQTHRQLNDLLLAQHLINRTVEPRPAECCPEETLATVLRHPDIFPQNHRIRLLPPARPRLRTDPDLLNTALLHLVENALRFSPGESRAEIIVFRQHNRFALEVMDRGIGIPTDFTGQLFQPFSRAANAAGYPGLGLGLFIAHAISLLLDGQLSLHPRDAGGTVARLVLPSR